MEKMMHAVYVSLMITLQVVSFAPHHGHDARPHVHFETLRREE